jgi:uncharacterized membrane protein YdjX (TVP38/TMEM64 family)
MRYPKLFSFFIAVVLAYIIFSNPSVSSFISNLGELGYIGSFIAGCFYTFGFTSPFSAGFFIDLNPSNIILTGILGGIGAFVGDMVIFSFAKEYFRDEFKKLRKENVIKKLGNKINSFFLYIIAVILIASPLPDEAGLTILAGIKELKPFAIGAISIVCNTIGILILLSV